MPIERAFPRLPAWLPLRLREGAPARLRRFGREAADIEIAFEGITNPVLIAQLLAHCSLTAGGGQVHVETMLDLPVGSLLEALLTLAGISDGLAFTWQFRCAVPECQCESEFGMTVEELAALMNQNRDQETVAVEIAGRRMTLRRPTGRDQLAWLQEAEGLPAAAMLRRLIVSPPLEALEAAGLGIEAIEAAVDEAMEDFDPLPGFRMQVVCPECEMSSTVAPALAEAALQRLVAAQERLQDDVHAIASRYHWNEAEILRMPAWRRQGYLNRIDAGDAWP